MSDRFRENSRRSGFLADLPKVSIESEGNDIAARCKFNFSYLCTDPAGKDIADLSHAEIAAIFEKLKHFSKETLKYWENRPVGKSGTVLAIYGGFPSLSKFKCPEHVPIEASWGRFRLDHTMRLAGFVIPAQYDGTLQASSGKLLDSNSFYVVFFDPDHKFWSSKESK